MQGILKLIPPQDEDETHNQSNDTQSTVQLQNNACGVLCVQPNIKEQLHNSSAPSVTLSCAQMHILKFTTQR
jgi:hypothetical protein